MARISPQVERQVRIEMLRARAAIERETLAQHIAEAGRTLQPANLMRSFVPANLLQGGKDSLLWQGVALLKRYPFLSSTLSALVLGKGRSRKALGVAGGLLAGWRLLKSWRGRKAS